MTGRFVARRMILLGLVSLVCVDVRADAASDRLGRLAAASMNGREKLIRIGLKPAHDVAVSATKGFRIIDPGTGKTVWKPRFSGELAVVAEGGPVEGAASVFRIQVGAFSSADAAETEKKRLARLSGSGGVVRHDPDRGNWRVRMGAAADRAALGPLMDTLRSEGIQGLWIAEEPAEAPGEVTLRLVDEAYATHLTGLKSIAVVTDGRVVVDGKPYRGIVELRVSPFGTVRPVNWIGLETYLLGVVPAELGPEVWPELEALRAQAVAARTYAWRNLGQFADEGFDLCATPRCQVYGGASAEHPLSDRAVWSTRDEMLSWKGEPIVALYTATCGGHTEDGREIFPEHAEPYLQGVPCAAEGDALASLRATISGRSLGPVVDETGRDVARDMSLLMASGVLEPGGSDRLAYDAVVDGAALHRWCSALCRLAGLQPPAGEPQPVGTLGEAARALMEHTGWAERAVVLLSASDHAAVLRDPTTAEIPVDQRRALAYLALVEALHPYSDGGFRADRPATLARLAPALVRVAESYQAFDLKQGIVSGVGRSSVRLVRGKGSLRLNVGEDAFLFGLSGGRPVAVERLEIWPGDSVRYRTGAGGKIDFLELQPPVHGTSDDRTSRVYSWEVRKTRREVERAVNRRVAVGRLKGLRVVRRGVSGRVVELEVIGSQASTVVRGFDVRRLLDLRESLLVIEPQRSKSGEIEAVVFTGKGWGHGVGLCQVGAYGMALRGASYREILGHYYRNAKLVRTDPGDR